MAHVQTQSEWEEEMSHKILSFLRDEIYMELRFLDIALSALEPKADNNLKTFATDGTYLYYSTEQLLRVFESNAAYLDRAYLHTVLHCIFGHLWICGKRDRKLWDLACDIAVEYTIDRMDKQCTRRILSWMRQQWYEKLLREKGGVSAAVIYRMLQEIPPEELISLSGEFYTDDHCYWPKQEDARARQEQAAENQKRWNKIARQTKLNQTKRGDETKEGEELLAAQMAAEKGRRSYRDFLQQFSVLREEIGIDQDEFDLNYYTYGLALYQNMPLIEPLESREVKKIQEFIIALDTSYSTSSGLVEHFLRETFDILTQKNSFFRESKVRVIQCDNQVRMDTEVSSEADISKLMKEFTVAGGGGTDFRPVFTYVNELLRRGEMKNLGGLLYFTDGKGIYPKKCPDYKTAFLFVEPLGDEEEAQIPPWAIRYQLEPEEWRLGD
jgi:predicted metal-dependent peptidase